MSEKEEKGVRSIPYTEHLRQMKKLRDLYERKLQALRGYYESELAIRSIALPYCGSTDEILDMDEPSPLYEADIEAGRDSGSNGGRSAGDGDMQEEAAPDMEEISDAVPEGSHYGNDGRQTDAYASGREALHEDMRQTDRMGRRNSDSSYENRRSNIRPGDYDAGYVGADGWTQHHVNPTLSRTDPSVYLRPGMQRTGADDEESAAGEAVRAVNGQAFVDAKGGDLNNASSDPYTNQASDFANRDAGIAVGNGQEANSDFAEGRDFRPQTEPRTAPGQAELPHTAAADEEPLTDVIDDEGSSDYTETASNADHPDDAGDTNDTNDTSDKSDASDASDAGYTPEQLREILKIWSQDNAIVSELEEDADDAEDAEYNGEGQPETSPGTDFIENHPKEVPDRETDLPEADGEPGEEMAASAESGYGGYETQSFDSQNGADVDESSFQNENQTYEDPNTGYQDSGDAEVDVPEDDGSAVYPQGTDPNAGYGDDPTDAGNVNAYPNENNGYDAASDVESIPASYPEGMGTPDVPYEELDNQEEAEPEEQAALEEAEEQAEPEEPSLRALGYDEVYAVEKDDLIFHYQRLELLKSGKQYADAEMFVAPFDLTKDRPDLLVWVLNGEDSRDYCSSHGDPNVHIKIKDCPLQISAQLVPSQTKPGKVHLAVRITLAPEQKQQGFQIRSTTQIHDGIASLCIETDKSMQIVVHMAPLDFHNDPQTGLVPFAYCIEKPGRRLCGDSINGPVYCDADGYNFEVLCKWDGVDENTVYGVLECKD